MTTNRSRSLFMQPFAAVAAVLMTGSLSLAGCSGQNADEFATPDGEPAKFSGQVQDEAGKPIEQAMVILSGGKFNGADTLTLFSDEEGRFAVEDITLAGSLDQIKAVVDTVGLDAGTAKYSSDAGALKIDIATTRLDDVAAQVPPSFWLRNMPDSNEHRQFISLCGNACHGIPTPKVQAFAASLQGLDREQRADLWQQVGLDMKQRYPLIFPDKKPATVMSIDVDASAYDLFSDDILARFKYHLADHFPTSFDKLDAKLFSYGAPIGYNSGSLVQEFKMPEGALVRELDFVPDNDNVWVVDYRQGKLGKLNITSGKQKWIDLPGDDPGPHTISPTEDGRLLIALMDYPAIVMFDPKTEKFEIFDKVPPRSDVHDITLDNMRNAAMDKDGGIWLTLASMNKLARLDMKTGEVQTFDAPLSNGRSVELIALYSAVMTSDKKHIWYTQLFGGVGSFNIETSEFESYFEFPYGDSPHRMAISDNDIVYVPLSGAGEVVAIDTKTSKVIRKYPLPDRKSSPYNLSWDQGRKVLWVGTSSSNLFYKLEPESGKFEVFPIPRNETFYRMITPHHETGDIWSSYAAYLPDGTAPSYVIRIKPGD